MRARAVAAPRTRGWSETFRLSALFAGVYFVQGIAATRPELEQGGDALEIC